MWSLQQNPPTATHATGRAEPPPAHAAGSATPAHGAAPSSFSPIPKAMSLASPGARGFRPPQGAFLPPQAAEKAPKSAGAIGRGSAGEEQTGCCARGCRCIGRAREKIHLPSAAAPGDGETRIKPTACISTEGGNHFGRAPGRGWPKGPAMLHLPIIQHQAPPGTTDQRQSSPKSPTFTAGAARSCGVGCSSKQHHRGKKIKRREGSPKST